MDLARKEEMEEFVAAVDRETDADVAGVSVSGLMTDSSEFRQRGALGIGLAGVDASMETLEGDSWETEPEEMEDLYRENRTEAWAHYRENWRIGWRKYRTPGCYS